MIFKYGFLNLGYDEEGYNKKGFDRNGYNRKGYDRSGYDKYGYNESGFNRLGYDKEGYNKEGFDSNGYNRKGYNKNGYDKNGYDIDGYDKAGYNSNGYNRDGYDRYGYDKNGYDDQGYDKEGYNAKGYDSDGYDRSGFDMSGYNEAGYDVKGYDRSGYDKYGYDKNGYDDQGYDKEGYNAKGYDRGGYDRSGFDISGYNRIGYDKQGYDKAGYNIDGFNVWGYDERWIDASMNSLLDYDSQGNDFATAIYNSIISINENRFDENGFDKKGYPKVSFNRIRFLEGLDEYTDVPQLNESDSDLPFFVVGSKVYHKTLGEGIVVEANFEYCKVVFLKTNTKMEFKNDNEWLSYTPQNGISEMITANDPNIFEIEKVNLEQTIDYIDKKYDFALYNFVHNKWKKKEEESTDEVLGDDGFYHFEVPDYYDFAAEEYKTTIRNLLNEPYFARVIKGDDDFYIGKIGTDDIVDWRSPKCKAYYQYQIFAGVKKEQLKLIRDFTICKGKLFGYIDKFDAETFNVELKRISDERLKSIIKAHRDNKAIHDIITSIQENQYNIITQDLNKNIMVMGCAGSGKTMIMLHRIGYLLYNYDELSSNLIYVISPTKRLSFENDTLSKALSLGEINNYVIDDFYSNIIKEYGRRYKIPFQIKLVNNQSQSGDEKELIYYEESYRAKLINECKSIIKIDSQEKNSFLEKCAKDICLAQDAIIQSFSSRERFDVYIEKISSIASLCSDPTDAPIRKKLKECENELKIRRKLIIYKKLLAYFVKNKCFLGMQEEDIKGIKNNKELARNLKSKYGYLDFVVKFFNSNVDFIPILDLEEEANKNVDAIRLIVRCIYPNVSFVNESIENLFNGLRLTPNNEAKQMIRIIDKFINKTKDLPYVAAFYRYFALNYYELKANNSISKSSSKISKTSIKEYGLPVYRDLFECNDYLNTFLNKDIDANVNTIFEMYMRYNITLEKSKRLNMFATGKEIYGFIPEIISYLFGEFRADEKYKINTIGKLYIVCNMCYDLFGSLDSTKKIICIDEFQNFSLHELMLLNDIYPNSVINLYGDFNQCIESKGINSIDVTKNLFWQYEQFIVNENYRNAIEITEFINRKFKLNMLPVGVNGQVTMLSYDDFSKFKYNHDDRIAYIVKDVEHINYEFMKSVGIVEGWKDNQVKEFPANQPVGLCVKDIKGLEFEVVIVDYKDMTYNEKYVASTRALSKLFVIS